MITYKVTVDDYGTISWYNEEGQLHCEHGPAILDKGGINVRYVNIHNPKCRQVHEITQGKKIWYRNGKLHREDGPAIECLDGSKFWYLNDQRHREDGPALEYSDGDKAWYLNGVKMTEEEHARATSGKEMSIGEIEKVLGYPVKIIKEK